jgi:methionyl-tRNA formyltransferase
MLESDAFREALPKIRMAAAEHPGTPQRGERVYYKRRDEDMSADAARDGAAAIAAKVRAFGIDSLGVRLATTEHVYKVFEATAVTNADAVGRLQRGTPGAVVLSYDGKLLVETTDGLLRLVRYSEIS